MPELGSEIGEEISKNRVNDQTVVTSRVGPGRIVMVQPKTPEDVELARIKANLDLEKAKVDLEKAKVGNPDERARLYCQVVHILLFGVFISFCFYNACWALVQIVSKPPWVEIIVAAIGALGPLSFFTWRLVVRLRRKVEKTEVEAAPQVIPPETPKEGGPT